MTTYYIMRHGCNSANQSMCMEMLVGEIEAKSRPWAEKEKFNQEIECYNNQYLSLWTRTDLIRKYGKREAEEQIENFYEDQAFDNTIVDAHCMLCGKFVERKPQKDAMNTVCKDKCK